MARSRNIKPGLFKNEILGEADPIYTLLFAGLWTISDKKGRLENRPKRIKAELFPYRFELDVCKAITWLKHESFINEYEVNGKSYLQVNKWSDHQSPHHKEVESVIPDQLANEKTQANYNDTNGQFKHEPSMNQTQVIGSASSSLIPDSLNPIPDSLKKTGDKKNNRFKPPTVEEVTDYCKERNNTINPQSFIDFYKSKGWMIGKNKMKDWKACVRTWEKNEKPNNQSSINHSQEIWNEIKRTAN